MNLRSHGNSIFHITCTLYKLIPYYTVTGFNKFKSVFKDVTVRLKSFTPECRHCNA